jgi:hypothetical protein
MGFADATQREPTRPLAAVSIAFMIVPLRVLPRRAIRT